MDAGRFWTLAVLSCCVMVIVALGGRLTSLYAPPICVSAPSPAAAKADLAATAAPLDNRTRVGWLYSTSRKAPYGLSPFEGGAYATDNSGNVVWEVASLRVLDPNTTVPVHVPGKEKVDALFIATANLLVNASVYRLGMHSVQQMYIDHTRRLSVPTLVAGLGSQVDFPGGLVLGNVNSTLTRGSESDSIPSDFMLDQKHLEWLKLVHASGGAAMVRGRFTEAVILRAAGPPPVAVGCPSLFLNHNTKLADVLRRKWDAVLQQRNTSLRLAVGLPHVPHIPHVGADYPESRVLLKFLADHIFKVFPNSFVVVQTKHDVDQTIRMLQQYGVFLGFDRVRYFYDIDSWVGYLKKHADMLFGFRIHGTMMGLAAEVPSVVISTDHRIRELAEIMAIPTTSLQDSKFNNAQKFDLFNFLAALGFDSGAFHERRKHIAKEYVRVFDRMKIGLHPGIVAISQL